MLIPPGKFVMGAACDTGPARFVSPLHQVTLTRPFYMAIHEITQEQYKAVTGTDPTEQFKGPKNPARNITYHAAIDFCKKVSAKTGRSVRLPTEAEWEYACRAGTDSKFYFAKDTDSRQEFLKKFKQHAWGGAADAWAYKPVGSLKPNPFGLYDMHGNEAEWVGDYFGELGSKPVVDPKGPETGQLHVVRGGASAQERWAYMSPFRCKVLAGLSDRGVGFRLVAAVNVKKPKE